MLQSVYYCSPLQSMKLRQKDLSILLNITELGDRVRTQTQVVLTSELTHTLTFLIKDGEEEEKDVAKIFKIQSCVRMSRQNRR